MKSEAGKVHLIRPTAAVQYRKNIAKFFNMRGGHWATVDENGQYFSP